MDEPADERADEPTVAKLGEFGLIQRIVARLGRGPAVALGPGDDAAVVRAPDGQVVATADALVEGRHFRRDWSGPYAVGRKAAAQNLADVVAMGASPTALLVALALPSDLPASWPLRLVDGLRDECEPLGASVVGGDVVGAEAVMVAVTALGDLGGRPPLTRSGARPGDVVAVAGTLGGSAAGLALLRAGRVDALPAQLAALVDAHRQPRPPYHAGLAAARSPSPPTAMIDVSDGLVADLGHIAAASGVCLRVRAAALPTPAGLPACAAEVRVDARAWALGGGEDHALAATFRPDAVPPAGWRVVGEVAAGSGVWVDGERWTGVAGWDHFG